MPKFLFTYISQGILLKYVNFKDSYFLEKQYDRMPLWKKQVSNNIFFKKISEYTGTFLYSVDILYFLIEYFKQNDLHY